MSESSAAILKPLGEVLYDDTLITIRTARESPETDFVLFQGWLERIARDAQRSMSIDLELVHVADELRKGRDYVVHGQARLSKGKLEGDEGAEDNPVLYSGLDCLFNPEGIGNCRGELTEISVDPGDPESESIKFNTFAEERMAEAQSWSWLRVLTYLAYIGRRTGDGGIGPLSQHDFRFWNLWQHVAWLDVDPDEITGDPPEDPWERILLDKPRSHVCEGLSWLDAWSWTCAQAGLGWVWECRYVEELSEFRWGIRLVVPGTAENSGDENETQWIDLKLPSPDYTVDDKTLAQIMADASVVGYHLVSDYGSIVNECALVGAPIVYEVTVELVPGWGVEDDWDVDPDDADGQAAALANVGEAGEWNAWAAKYHLEGTWIGSGDNWWIGRLWGLNTVGKWTDRWRPFEPCITGYMTDAPRPPWVEVSYDGGTTWKYMSGGVRVMRRDARVYIEIPDLRDLKDADGTLFPEGYIKGLLRVRVTAGLRGDLGVDAPLVSSNWSLSYRQRYKLLLERTDVQLNLREDVGSFSGGNSQWKGSIYPIVGRNDLERATRMTVETIKRYDRVLHRGPVTLPLLVFPHVEQALVIRVRPGDLAVGILAEPGAGPHDLVLGVNTQEGGALVAAVEWRYGTGAPRKAAQASTSLRLEDAKFIVRRSR